VNSFLDLGRAGFLSQTGQCKPFDASADGYCRAEGAGLVVLKKLSEATSAGNNIFGVIPSIATNQGGLSSSLTVPSSTALKSLYRNILQKSGFQASQISYAEAHGTGTQAGDPIEMESIRSVFGSRSRSIPLSIGSIKGNIGHCESAAGVAGLLKVLAMMKYGGIPPQASHNQLNPKIPPIENDGMEINRRLRNWDASLRAALVNSYGAAGSNCALLCCEMPERRTGAPRTRNARSQKVSFPIILSAASKATLVSNARALATHLSKNLSQADLADIAFTLDQRRKRHRFCFDTFATDKNTFNSVECPSFEYPNQPKPIVLVLSGQYDTKVALDRGIYNIYPAFRSYIDACDSEIVRLGYQTIQTVAFQTTPIASAISLQCSIFAVQYACARCWIDSGLKPDAIIGHSLGELVALAVSEVLSFGDCLQLVAFRAHLIDTKWGAERGVMLAIHTGSSKVQKLTSRLDASFQGATLEIACYNASTSTIVVGTSAVIDLAERILSADAEFLGIKFQRLSTTHAFHSPFTEPILSELEKISRSLNWNNPSIPLETCTRESLSYMQEWNPSRHAREPVYFFNAVQRVEQRLGSCVWFEAGLDTPIISMTKRACSDSNTHIFQRVRTNIRENPWDCIGTVVSDLWRCGISLSHWAFLEAGRHDFKQVWLPPYQLERQPHWTENIDRVLDANQKVSNSLSSFEPKNAFISPGLVFRKEQSSLNSHVIDFSINTKSERYQKIVSGHVVLRQPLCPAPMHMECTAMAIHVLIGDFEAQSLAFEELHFQSALGLDPAREVDLRLEELVPKQSWRFTVRSILPGLKSEPLVHCVGTASLQQNVALTTYGRLVESNIDKLQSSDNVERLMSKRAYGLFSKVMHYPPFFQGISSIALNGNEAVAAIKLPENQPRRDESAVWRRCDTVLIDAFISVVGLLLNSSDAASETEIIIAVGIERVVLTPGCQTDSPVDWLVYAKFMSMEGAQQIGDVFVCSPKREVVAMMVGVQFAKVDVSKMGKSLMSANASVSPPHLQQAVEAQLKRTTPADVSSSGTKSTGSPTLSEDCLDTEIKDIISNYTGLNTADIPQDVVLVDLGLDSLSSIEFVAEVQSNFRIELKPEELSAMTLDGLTRRLARSPLSESLTQVEADIAGGIMLNTARISPSTVQYENTSSMESIVVAPPFLEGPRIENYRGKSAQCNPFEALLETDRHFEDAANQRGYSGYHSSVFSLQNNLTLAYILEAFENLGVNLLSFSAGSVIPPISYIPKHDKLMSRLWEILQNRGIVTKQASILIRGRANPGIGPSKEIYESFVSQFPRYLPEAKLIKLAGENLARCFKGDQDPLALLFGSPTSSKIMEDYYCNSPMVSTLTDQLVTFVITLLRSWKSNGNEQIRILEVGAGTGGTTARLADRIQEACIACRYTFTDISSRMVSKAKDKLAKYPWISFETFDLEKEVPNAFRNQFDIIIGTNCVHATTNTTMSCRRIGETLNEDGVVILSEGTKALDWFDIVFGQLDGWWLAEDGRQHPIQPASEWMETLQAAGFQSGSFSRGPTREAFTQQLLVGSKKKWPIPMSSEPAPTESQSDSYRLETMVYKEVSGVQIHADVYVPRQAQASPLPIGTPFPLHPIFMTNVTV
jgi:acyl transferase domain-containing protein/SAM-dependent methyltransferase